MSVGKSSVAIGGGIVGGGGVTVGGGYGVHKVTEETVEGHFGEELLSSTNKVEEWKKLEKKLKDSKEQEKSYGLGEVTIQSDPDGQELVKWCTAQKGKSYGSFLYKDHMYVLKIKTYCIYTIKDKLGEDSTKDVLKTEGKTHETDFKTSFSNLSSLNGPNTTNGNVTEEQSLNEIKNKYSKPDNGWEPLRDWCKWALGKSYKDESNNLFKLTKYLCTKNKTTTA